VGKIFTSDGKSHTSFVIKPQGIVEVVSAERLEMPEDVAGTAIVKTSLSDRGLLALNIGIIDPEYKGKVSSYLVNFSSTDQTVDVGEPFLRASFFKLSSKSSFSKVVDFKDDDYELNSKRKIVSLFSDTFLNTDQVIKRFLDESMEKYRNRLLAYVSGAALTLAVLTLFLNFGNLIIVHRWLDPRQSLQDAASRDLAARTQLQQTLAKELRRENQALKDRVTALETNARRRRP
jgi:dUTPase